MTTHQDELDKITEHIIGAAFTVGNQLGYGFLEKIYENALVHELRQAGFDVKQQYPIKVRYDGIVVGNYVADLLVADHVLVELKAIKALTNIEIAQCLNYLKATGLHVCLLLNLAFLPDTFAKFLLHRDSRRIHRFSALSV